MLNTFEYNESFYINIHEVNVFSDVEGERIGFVRFNTNINSEVVEHDIWYDDEGSHYICMPSNEFDENEEELLEVMLLSDLLSICELRRGQELWN